jgi:hypothetical protein
MSKLWLEMKLEQITTSEVVTSSKDEREVIDELSCMSGSGAEAVDARMPATFERKKVAKSLAENLSVVE